VSGQRVPDDEVLLRRIPPGDPWFEPPDRVSTYNFKLRKDELGISVYRRSVVSEEELLGMRGAIRGSFVLSTGARHIRDLKNAEGISLRLDVVAVDDEDDPGHAEIRGPKPGKLSRSASQALRRLFASSLRRA